MNETIHNLEQRLRILEDPMRLRWSEAASRETPDSSVGARGQCDVMRLRWHTEATGAAGVG